MKNKETKFYIVFFVINLLLSSYFIDLNHNWNSTSRALPLLTYAEKGSFTIEKYDYLTGDKAQLNGKLYTDKSPITSFLTMPFYGILRVFGLQIEGNENDLKPIYFIGGILCSSIPFSLILLFALKAFKKMKPIISPIFLVMLSFYGSMLFVFSGTFFSHLLAGILILLGYIELKKHQKFLIAGLLTGLAFATEFPLGIFIPLWAILVWWNERSLKKMIWFSLGCLPGVAIILAYNYHYTGSPFLMLYNFEANKGFAEEFAKPGTVFGFSLPSPKNLWELVFGQFKGILFYVPVLILIALHYYKYAVKMPATAFLKNYFTTPVLCFIVLIISKESSWWGGWTYGPRYLIPAIILLMYEGIIQLSENHFSKNLFYFLSVFGLLCAWIAKATVVNQIPSDIPYPMFDFVVHKFTSAEFNSNNLLTLLFNLKPSIAIYLWLLLYGISCYLLNVYYKKLIRIYTKNGINCRIKSRD